MVFRQSASIAPFLPPNSSPALLCGSAALRETCPSGISRHAAAVVLVWSAAWLAACGAAGSGGDRLRVRVAAADGSNVPAFQVVVGTADAARTFDCPGAEGCSDGGLDAGWAGAEGTTRPAVVAVKAPGYRTARAAQVAWDGRVGSANATLAPLPAFAATADYRTGFAADSGLDDFIAQAFPSSDDLGPTYAVKFYIDGVDGAADVYFQHTTRWFTHVDFARSVLGKAMTTAEFERQTYRNEGRTGIAGTILYRPDLVVARPDLGGDASSPLTIEFFPSDHLTPEHARTAYLQIQERLLFSPLSGATRRLFYLPAGSVQQTAAAQTASSFFAVDALWFMREDVFANTTVQYLNPGVAYGTLRVLTPEQLDESIVSFRDILVLTRLPNQVPVSGGTITGELQTPLAHVNVAARARGTPNLALIGAADDPRVAPLVGRLVRFQVKPGSFSLTAIPLSEAVAFWEAAGNKPKLTPGFDLTRDDLPLFGEIGFADAASFGTKAANLAELSHDDVLGVPTAPRGFGVPFRFYDEALDRVVTTACGQARALCVQHGGTEGACATAAAWCTADPSAGYPADSRTLRAFIDDALTQPEAIADSQVRWAAMDMVRSLFCLLPLDAAFAAKLDARVAEVFGSERVRLRSSSNAEDLPGFSGAGLYSSLSANRPDEPASGRICEVWASAWNWRAVEERTFWNVDQAATRMGVAVATAYPTEAANGVLITRNLANPLSYGMYVNVQLGEVSVTNPEDGAIPEVFSIVPAPDSIQVARQRYSSLSPDKPILSDAEVEALYQAAWKVQTHFGPLYCGGSSACDAYTFPLDLEFKFVGADRHVVVKQVRPYASTNL